MPRPFQVVPGRDGRVLLPGRSLRRAQPASGQAGEGLGRMAVVEFMALSAGLRFAEASVVELAARSSAKMEMSRGVSADGFRGGGPAAKHRTRQSARARGMGPPDRGATEPVLHACHPRASAKGPIHEECVTCRARSCIPHRQSRRAVPGFRLGRCRGSRECRRCKVESGCRPGRYPLRSSRGNRSLHSIAG